MESNRIIVTVVGKDKIGIIAEVAQVLSRYRANILDISQTLLQEFFTMIMIVDLDACEIDLNELKERLDVKGKEIGVEITVQHEDVFKFMHRI